MVSLKETDQIEIEIKRVWCVQESAIRLFSLRQKISL